MRIDWYTKATLTVIALLLAVIAARPYVLPPVAAAQATKFSSIQFLDVNSGFVAIESGSKLWYYNNGNNKPILLGEITGPGEPLRGGKWGVPER